MLLNQIQYHHTDTGLINATWCCRKPLSQWQHRYKLRWHWRKGLGQSDIAVARQSSHYSDVIMSTIASLITSLAVVYSTVYSDADQRKHQSSASLAFVWGTGEFPAQRASYAENVSIWWRHHVRGHRRLSPRKSRLNPTWMKFCIMRYDVLYMS